MALPNIITSGGNTSTNHCPADTSSSSSRQRSYKGIPVPIRKSMSTTSAAAFRPGTTQPFQQPQSSDKEFSYKKDHSGSSSKSKASTSSRTVPTTTTIVFDEEGRTALVQKMDSSLTKIRRSKSEHSRIPCLTEVRGGTKVTTQNQRNIWTLSPAPGARDPVRNNAPQNFQHAHGDFHQNGESKNRAKAIRSDTTLPKIKTPVIPQSETKGSYANSITETKRKTSKSTLSSLTYRAKTKQNISAKSSPEIGLSSSSWTPSSTKAVPFAPPGEVELSKCKSASRTLVNTQSENQSKYAGEKMRTARSELSLLEQKRLQWAQEREELNGLWSPWGRQSGAVSPGKHSPSKMQASYPSPTNVVSSSYVSNLGIGPTNYSSPHSEPCYLPPINSTIASLPRQKAKVWNAEFQTEDYRYENEGRSSTSHNHLQLQQHPTPNGGRRASVSQLSSSRKASLPNYMYDTGETYAGENNGSNNYGHQQMIHQQHNRMNNNAGSHNNLWSSNSLEDEAFTSGYYSSENNNVDDSINNGQRGRGNKEIILKPTSRERSYQEEVTVQKAIAIKGRGDNNSDDVDGSQSPRVIVHKIYTQNGEVFAEHDVSQEYIVNSMTVMNSGRSQSRSGGREYVQHQGQHESGRSPLSNLPRNHAMRSSLTIGVDASNMDAYYENDRRKKEEWLNELEKQREEQRLRKMMEKEEKRPRWGDRGIGVGHFWEPSDSENSHLPPYSSRGKSTGRSEPMGNSFDSGSGRGGETNHHGEAHPGQSYTPPAWLERSLSRMQSSKSQPSLHDPNYMNDFGEQVSYNNNVPVERGNVGSHSSSRSLNQSTIDLRNVAGYCSPTGESDRTFIRGQNVPIDPDTLSERERKRQANQEHLEALKKQIEERKQKEKEEKERRLQEEREEEMRIARQREIELQRLEMEKRGKMPVNGDMPNSVEETTESRKKAAIPETTTKISTLADRASRPVRDPSEVKDIEIVQRQSAMMVTTPTEEEKGEESSSASVNPDLLTRPRLSRQDQCVMTDSSDPNFERTLTPSAQRSRSLSLCRSSREFGTQTELSDGSSSSGSACGSGKNSEKTRSHNSLLDKKEKEKIKPQQKKTEERPRWGSNPVKKQYIKQSEKDPNYISRMRRRQERLKRMEEERSARADTGTESEDVSIPFYRIRQRRNNSEAGLSPQRGRGGRGIAPLKATVPLQAKTENDGGSGSLDMDSKNKSIKKCIASSNTVTPRDKISGGSERNNVPCPHSHSMKNSKSETHLNKSDQTKEKTSDILDRNFGSIAGINVMGTSEESSVVSTPFLPRRDLGSGSTGSGTTGSGSGVQSPDLAYHQIQAEKCNRQERKFSQINSGRDSYGVVKAHSENNLTKTGTTIESNHNSRGTTRTEFKSPLKGFIHQQEFDEMPIKPMRSSSTYNIPETPEDMVVHMNPKEKAGVNCETSSDDTPAPVPTSRGRRSSPRGKMNRNKSISPKRKPSTQKFVKSPSHKSKGKSPDGPRTATIVRDESPHEPSESPVLPENKPSSPPVPALLKKMQMGLAPDESGRISSLPTEFPDILAPLPAIPIALLSPEPSRISSATSGASSTTAPSKIDIDIAVTRRNSPGVIKLLEAADERLKQRQLTAIMNESNNNSARESIFDNRETISARSRPSFEADIGSISINLEPLLMYQPNGGGADGEVDNIGSARGRIGSREFEVPLSSARLSIKSHSISPRPPPTARSSEAARHEAFITSILNSKEVKEQLSARESELSEKGIIEFSIKLPSTSSGDEFVEEYRDPLLTERRRHTAQWLYGSQGGGVPQKQAILTNLSTLKKGLSLQQQDWKIGHSDTE